MNAKETHESIKDLAFAIRRIVLLLPRIHPSPDVSEVIEVVEKRMSAITARLGVEE